jgi:beta-lactamase regulating signal transducer with metallopeptidase domain
MISLLIEAALRTLLVALAVAGGLRLLRVSNVLAQKRTWCLVLAAALAMPLLMRWQWLSASAPIRVPVHFWGQRADSRPAEAATAPSYPPSAATPLGVSPASGFASQPVDSWIAPVPLRSAEPAPAVAPQSRPNPIQPLTLAWILYLGVGALLLARLLYGIAAAARLWATAEPVCLAPEPDLTVGMRLRSSSRIASPVAVGSGVVLPADYARWDRQKLRIVLAHERSHVRQGDFYLQALAGLHAALFWFSPLGWWLKRKLSDLGEAVSDRAGLEVAASRSSYAQILLEFAALPRPTLIGVAMARSSRLSHRMERFLNEPSFRLAFAGSSRRMALAVLLVPAAFFAFTALIRVEAAQQSTAQVSTPAVPGAALSTTPVPPVNPTPLVPPTPVPSTSMAAPEQGSVAAAAGALQMAQDQPESANHRVPSGLVPESERQDSYAVISPNRKGMSFSGTWDDLTSQQIETARKLANGEFLWFTHEGKAYIVDDPVAIAQIESQCKSMEELGKQQKELELQQKELGKQQKELARKMGDATFHTPDMSKEIADLEKQMAKLKAMQGKAMTAEEWAEMESKLGNLQGKLGSIEGGIASSQGALGSEMGKLGSLQGELGGKQGLLGAEQGKTWQQFDSTVRAIIGEALKEGKARPVE